MEFLRGFYAPNFTLILLPQRDFRESLRNFITKQHDTALMGDYYSSLFLADGLPKEWRKLAQAYGIAHLFAISGFHTGILSAIGFFILGFLYKPIHRRFFPFRNFFFDVGCVVILGLVGYYFLLTQSFSYLRALTMSFVLFVLFWRGLNLWNIETLMWCVAILVAFSPTLIFSLGFHLSWLGVLYVFLFFKTFKIPAGFWGKTLYGFLLNTSTFFLMNNIVFYFFPIFSPLMLSSVLLTPLFTLYYPLALFAHCVGFGGFLDSLLLMWLQTNPHTVPLQTHFTWLILCAILTCIAPYFRLGFFSLLGLSFGFFGYGVYLYFYGF